MHCAPSTHVREPKQLNTCLYSTTSHHAAVLQESADTRLHPCLPPPNPTACVWCAPSRALLQAGKQAAGDGSGLTPTQRALLQFGVGLDTPDPSGTIGLNSWARAYLVIFSNIFDFFADTNGDGEPDGESTAAAGWGG